MLLVKKKKGKPQIWRSTKNISTFPTDECPNYLKRLMDDCIPTFQFNCCPAEIVMIFQDFRSIGPFGNGSYSM